MGRVMGMLFLCMCAVGIGCSKSPAPGDGGTKKPGKAVKKTDRHGPHDGALVMLQDGAGYVEVKLYEGKGDIEVWLGKDDKFTKPIDLPLDTKISITFADKDNKVTALKVRNTKHNEDKDGAPNIRAGKTNYFIYTSTKDDDGLKSSKFRAEATVTFTQGDKSVSSESFQLTPYHSH